MDGMSAANIALATAWRPRGEQARFLKLLPVLERAYAYRVIALPPDVESDVLQSLQALPGWQILVTADWSWGRYQSVQRALEGKVTHIHYVDFDRLLHWVETRKEEWLAHLQGIGLCDCLIAGRTAQAYATHPQALIQTEHISNRVISYLLGQTVDVSAGSKGFSRPAAEHILSTCQPGHALGTDGEWPVVLHQAGFQVNYTEVDGLDWESADRYQDQAATSDGQQAAAGAYDADPRHWEGRAKIADEIVEYGLRAVNG